MVIHWPLECSKQCYDYFMVLALSCYNGDVIPLLLESKKCLKEGEMFSWKPSKFSQYSFHLAKSASYSCSSVAQCLYVFFPDHSTYYLQWKSPFKNKHVITVLDQESSYCCTFTNVMQVCMYCLAEHNTLCLVLMSCVVGCKFQYMASHNAIVAHINLLCVGFVNTAS